MSLFSSLSLSLSLSSSPAVTPLSLLALVQPSCQAWPHLNTVLMWCMHRGICVWHLPNDEKLSAFLAVCRWVIGAHLSRRTQVAVSGARYLSLRRSQDPLGTSLSAWACCSGLLVYTLWAISCTPTQTLSAGIKYNWPSGVTRYDVRSFLLVGNFFFNHPSSEWGPFLVCFCVCL